MSLTINNLALDLGFLQMCFPEEQEGTTWLQELQVCPTPAGHVPAPSASLLLLWRCLQRAICHACTFTCRAVPAGWLLQPQKPAPVCRGSVRPPLTGLQLTQRQGCAVRGSGTQKKNLPALKNQRDWRQNPAAQQPDWLAPQQGTSSPDSCSWP